MIKNYLKVAIRNLMRNKFYSILNISGLAIGVACCLLIVLFVTDELSYDKYYDNSENTYRLTMAGALNGSAFDLAVVGDVVGQTLMEDFPEVINYVRFRQNGAPFIRSGENIFKEEKYVWADQSVIDIFGLQMVSGDATSALTAPKSLLMSESAAKKYF